MFEIGDKVQVVDIGNSHDTYEKWAYVHGLDKYRYGESPALGVDFTVVARGFHELSGQGMLYGITDGKHDYIMAEDGLKLAPETVQYEWLWYGVSGDCAYVSDGHFQTKDEALKDILYTWDIKLKKKHIHKVKGSKRKVQS